MTTTRPWWPLLVVAGAQVGLFGALVWYGGTQASPGPSLRSVAELLAPVIAFGLAAGVGGLMRRRLAPSAPRLPRLVSTVVQLPTLIVFVLLALVTPPILFAELVFEGIG